VGKNGYAKLADFGLAKLEDRSTPDAVTRTIHAETTKRGMIVGTVPYMSPEHASGRPTDTRSDIFSFGVLLYELLAGRRPFQGESDLETLQKILHGVAPPLGAEVPIALRMVVEKAMEKDPVERYQSTRDLVVDLRRLSRQSGETSAPSMPGAPRNRGLKWVAIAAGVLIALALIAGSLRLWLRLAPDAPRPVVQFEISSPPGSIYTPLITRQPFAISPDGRRLAFSATGDHGTNIFIRELASSELRLLAGTEDAWSMFWSPDGRSIFFGVRNTLKQVNVDSGAGRAVAELPDVAQLGTWRSNGDLLVYIGAGATREIRMEDGSLRDGPSFGGMRWPEVLPGGDRLVFGGFDKAAQYNRAFVADYSGQKITPLMQTSSRIEYAPPLKSGEPGDLLFISGTSLLSQPFQADQMRVAGKPFPVASNVIYFGANLAASFSVSENGVLVYQANFPDAQLKWYDRGGTPTGDVGRPAQLWGNARLSRDGKRVAASVWNAENGSPGVWIFDSNGRESRRITYPPEIHLRPVWSPDGTHLACGRSLNGPPKLAILDVAGNAAPQEFLPPKQHFNATPTDWSADGRIIALDDGVGEEQHVAWIADVRSREITPLLKKDFAQWGTAFAPDGKRIAFVSVESGRPEVCVQSFDAEPSPHVAGESRQVSRDGAWLVRWRADGRELFYLGLNNTVYSVPVEKSLQFGEPTAIFRIPGPTQYGTTRDFQFDVSPDGQRFIIPTTGSIPPPPFTVIENWQEKFRR
jgi:eukaryotic-like serine/threonine-protein kinase